MSAPPASNGEAPMPMFQMSNPVSVIVVSSERPQHLFVFVVLNSLMFDFLLLCRQFADCH